MNIILLQSVPEEKWIEMMQALHNMILVDPSVILISSLTIFALAIFVGFEIITKVPPTLHTPLMSGSNAISGITIVGALAVASSAVHTTWSVILGLFAVLFAMINVVGGFYVTHRMLAMFKKK
jgi:proton-translocating NAD(P)+ transhydrogenase subunit alpha